MWEITVTYEDDQTGKRYNHAKRMSNVQFDALKRAGLLEQDIARTCDDTVQEFLWLERQEAEAKLLAKNCKSMDELESAAQHWWDEYHRYKEAQRYSASCISDSEHMRDALANWQDCLARRERIQSGKENI